MDWSGCNLVEVILGKVSGELLFKGTRLPARTVIENVDVYMDEGLTLDQAIEAMLESFPSVPYGAEGVRAVLSFRTAFENQPVS